MNGLEAIKVMMEGKLVSKFNSCMEDEIYKIIDGNVCVKFEDEPDEKYEVSEDFDFDSIYHEYIAPKSLTGWERLKDEGYYFAISVIGDVKSESKYFGASYEQCYNSANAFATKEKAEEINFKQTLFRKLQRFSDENGGTEIDWNDEDQTKFSIKYSHWSSKLSIDCYNTVQQFGQVYFASKEVARKAIELFHDDLIKYFTM